MKKVLFLGVTNYDFKESSPLHLKAKFLGLSRDIEPYILARGRPFHKKIWNSEFYLLPYSIFWLFAFFIAFYICLNKKIDVIIAQSPLIEGLTGSILKNIFKKQLIVEIHGDWERGPFLSKKRRFEFFQKKFIPVLARISFKNADKIRGVANYLIEEAKKIASDKRYFSFSTFTDLELFLNEKNTRYDKFILFVGQLEKVKGIDVLVKAFSEIEKEFFDFKLIIIGDGKERQNLKNLSSKLRIREKVEFRGKLSLEETKNIMKNCYFLVLPSLSEGLPRVLMEAMALKKPVMASNVGGIPEIVKNSENGFLFEKGNTKDLVEKMKILLKNKNLVEKIGVVGNRFVIEKFSNEKYIKSYISMINA
ncbi:MAG: glycosyltransferase family 4 protein [Patescibacteria group bacterium]|nr:glycosyltransferase family 4 protein [Patescibacteria group bacterium]